MLSFYNMNLSPTLSFRSFTYTIIISVLCCMWGCAKDDFAVVNTSNNTFEKDSKSLFFTHYFNFIKIENLFVGAFLYM